MQNILDKEGHKSIELARLFYRELAKIHANAAWTHAAKTDALARLLELLFLEVTKEENIQFTTLFARIAYAGHKFHMEKRTLYWVHLFRRKIRSKVPQEEVPMVYALGLRVFSDSIQELFGQAPIAEVQPFIPDEIPYAYAEVHLAAFRRNARVLALEDDQTREMLLARDEENPTEIIYIQYNIPGRNELFEPTIRQIRKSFGFPVLLSLIDVEVTVNDESSEKRQVCYRPRAIVAEPDYLLDVTTIAGCFQGSSAEPVIYLLQKFLPQEQSLPMILGNVANFFLDELMNNPEATFRETFPKVFKTNPLTFAQLSDAEIRTLAENSQKHWVTLQAMVRQGIKDFDIEPSESYLEPSFYDEIHGLQGRLDVLYKNENRSAIIELKSGSPFLPNIYGIGASHFIQTLLYDLMVRAVLGEAVEHTCYILYSGLESQQLRFAPVIKAKQNEALQIRNQLVAIDRLLANIRSDLQHVPILSRIKTTHFPQLKGFHQKNIERFECTYHGLNDLERRYFNAFAGLIAREHQLAKTGIQGRSKANGLAALWLNTLEEKEANFQILKSLKIKEERVSEDEPVIIFEKTIATNQLANFRTGDIAVLYPSAKEQPAASRHQSPVTTQIFKVTILGISSAEVKVKLRYKQFNTQIFSEFETWNLEHDIMDVGFLAMYQGLFRWAASQVQSRELLLTTKAPEQGLLPPYAPEGKGEPTTILKNTTPAVDSADALTYRLQSLTEEQRRILEKMLSTRDYFLLWGPPGTGKTSQMLCSYAGWIFKNTEENLLLLAYTNRAVDEICEALDSLGDEVKDAYLRIGSPYSSGEEFENQLLSSKISHVKNRKELLEIIHNHRIFVSTLASLSSNQQLLQLKKFRRVVIDEASQILEPMLVGLLPQFEQFILIGDHKQLPAIVVQDEWQSAISDEKLHTIGLQNLRNSLFERLYRRCTNMGWSWAFDHLSYQGRMHEEIMHFPAVHFYEGNLKTLPAHIAASQRQTALLPAQVVNSQQDWEHWVTQKRLLFLSTPIDQDSPSRKTNQHEAKLIAALIRFFQKKHISAQGQSIGVITPYRAQIAQIQETLQSEGIDFSHLTIDTVERYQGGARDIILISLCTNFASQMETLVSLGEDGVDRKLNVALTRAREQVVVLGNRDLLLQNEVYSKLITWCEQGLP